MSPARTKTAAAVLDDRPEFADLLPGTADPDHYRRSVPRYAVTSEAIEAAEAEVEAIERRLATLDERRRQAIDSGDRDAVLAVLSDERSGPVELHAARIRAAVARHEYFKAEEARVAEESRVLADPAQLIIRLQKAVLDEAALIRSACNAADAARLTLADHASQARFEADRLRRIDPTKTPVEWATIKRDPTHRDGTSPASSIWQIKTAGPDIVEINGKPIVQVDENGQEKREDGYRLRVDGVLIDDDGRPVADSGGRVRRFLSAVRR